jgi:ketosteroid isomerase-like protein
MSQENVEIVRSFYAEWEQGNMRSPAGVDLFDPEVVYEAFMPDSDERVVAHGLEGIAAFMREWLAQWQDYRLIGDEFREVGSDTVFVAGRQAAVGRRSGVAVEGPIFSIWTFRDGKVVHLRWERYRRAALEAAGLSE